MTAYLQAIGRFHRYSLYNQMLIAFQKPTASLVAGFNSWKSKGRYVKKGEKGIVILAHMIYKNKKKETNERDPEPSIPGVPDYLAGFKPVYVFDVSQTEGEPLPEFEIGRISGDPADYLDRIKNLIAAKGIQLSYDGSIAPNYGLSHELLHKGDRRQQTTRTIRETEAEAVSFVVSSAIGLDLSTHSADYIQLYNGNKETLSESLQFIH